MMIARSIVSSLIRGDDGAYSTAYGAFVLQSALQPIFRKTENGLLEIAALEGLARANRDGMPFSPSQFFPMVDDADMRTIDSLLRTMHILNCGQLKRAGIRIFVNFDTRHYDTEQAVRYEIERIKLAARESDITPDRIICEVTEFQSDVSQMKGVIACLRESGFGVALDEYGAGDNDVDRIKTLRPDYVKFDGRWVRDFMHNTAGVALLRVIVRQFVDQQILPVFEGLEETWQVELCQEIDVPLMQGYALARPDIAPTRFNSLFPETPSRPASAPARSATQTAQGGGLDIYATSPAIARKSLPFGRKGR